MINGSVAQLGIYEKENYIAGWTGVVPARSHKPNDGGFKSPSRH